MKLRTVAFTALAAAFAVTALVGCGGGSSSGSMPPPISPAPADFAITVQPAALFVPPGSSAPVQIQITPVNQFAEVVNVAIAGLPEGVTSSPSTISITGGGQQTISISAQTQALPAGALLSLTATSGHLTHTAYVALGVQTPEGATHSPSRTRYLRTDAQYDPNGLQFSPPPLTVYDAAHRRLFVSNYSLNRVDVFDMVSERQIGSILVPQPFGLDMSPDCLHLYIGTLIGDLYIADPVGLQLLQRFPSAGFGTTGYDAGRVFLLADNTFVLLGSNQGFFVDGVDGVGVWSPSSNALTVIHPATFDRVGQIAVLPDRSRFIVSDAHSGRLLSYESGTGDTVTGNFQGGTVSLILPTPDSKRLFIFAESGAGGVFDSSSLAQIATLSVDHCSGAALSRDGTRLYIVDRFHVVEVYDTTSLQQIGWVPNFNIVDGQSTIVPGAMDETGLLAGPIGHGVVFLDASIVYPGTTGTLFNLGFLNPAFGPASGGTPVQVTVNLPGNVSLSPHATMFLGSVPARQTTAASTGLAAKTPAALVAGPVDLIVKMPDGSIGIMPENFSYGPSIVNVSTNAASADGNSHGVIFGYGLGQQGSAISLSIGGQNAAVEQVAQFGYPFPMEAVFFTIPPGIAGEIADVRLGTDLGSAIASNAFHYLPAVKTFTLPGRLLQEGVYDPHRHVLYFTDLDRIQIFSTTLQKWLSPVFISGADNNTSLRGLGLSPDGMTLAISDSGNARIYTMNPDMPSSMKTFNANTLGGYQSPCGVTVTNQGMVYFTTFDTSGVEGGPAFHKLNSTTATITDLSPLSDGGLQSDSYNRVVMNPDGSRVYAVSEGIIYMLNTVNDTGHEGLQISPGGASPEISISGDGTRLTANGYVADANMGALSAITYIDRDTLVPQALYGQKMNPNGSLLYQPLLDGIDILDANSGLLKYRVQLPQTLAAVYDTLVVDTDTGLLYGIMSGGIVQFDFRGIAAQSATAGTAAGLASVRQQAIRQDLPSVVHTRSAKSPRTGSTTLHPAKQLLNTSVDRANRK